MRDTAWLLGPDGKASAPTGLSLTDLPAEYHRDEELARALRMRTTVLDQASEELGIPADVLRHLQANPDEITKIVKQLKMRHQSSAARSTSAGPGPAEPSFAVALATSFERPQIRTNDERVPAVGLALNPEHRRERVREDINQRREGDASRQRFALVDRKVWEGRDSSVRHFLLEQYAGRCQICQATFLQRDGSPYFEGLHLAAQSLGSHVDRPGGSTVPMPDMLSEVSAWHCGGR